VTEKLADRPDVPRSRDSPIASEQSSRDRIVSAFELHSGHARVPAFEEQTMRYMLLWILGVPIPVLILIWLMWGH